jgi:hypothetical protein
MSDKSLCHTKHLSFSQLESIAQKTYEVWATLPSHFRNPKHNQYYSSQISHIITVHGLKLSVSILNKQCTEAYKCQKCRHQSTASHLRHFSKNEK